MTPGDRDRFLKCLTLAERGATLGERTAGRAAAERIAVGAGLTFDEARVDGRQAPGSARAADARGPKASRPTYAWARPQTPPEPVTVEELLRQKAETAAWRKRRTAAAMPRRDEARRAQAAWEAEARDAQAKRDRAWEDDRAPRAERPDT